MLFCRLRIFVLLVPLLLLLFLLLLPLLRVFVVLLVFLLPLLLPLLVALSPAPAGLKTGLVGQPRGVEAGLVVLLLLPFALLGVDGGQAAVLLGKGPGVETEASELQLVERLEGLASDWKGKEDGAILLSSECIVHTWRLLDNASKRAVVLTSRSIDCPREIGQKRRE